MFCLSVVGGQQQPGNNQHGLKKGKCGSGVGGNLKIQPKGPRGVSNCVIKYTTGSIDLSAGA